MNPKRCDCSGRIPIPELESGFLWIASGRNGHRTKSGKGRWVPMPPRLVAAMKHHVAKRRFVAYDGTRPVAVFHHTTTARKYRAGERIKSMRHSFEAAANRANLPDGFHQHDLRHRRVTTWLAEGRDIVKVKEAIGHSDLRTTMGYTQLAREHLKDLVTTAGRGEATSERRHGSCDSQPRSQRR